MKGWTVPLRAVTTFLFLTLAAAGCAATGATGEAARAGGRASQVITREQILNTTARNAWEVLRTTVRYIHWGVGSAGVPQRATRRGTTSGQGPDQVRVVVDGTTLVNLSDLTLIPASDLQEIRVLNGLEATTYFGTNSVAGAVLITTRR